MTKARRGRLYGLAVVLCLLWSLGVPAYFGWRLYTHRKIIQAGNADFAGIAHRADVDPAARTARDEFGGTGENDAVRGIENP